VTAPDAPDSSAPPSTEPSWAVPIRLTYDTVAADYADTLRTAYDDDPTDQAVVGLFAELVRAGGGGPVADLGCGTGRLTPYLARLGLDVVGLDLSPGMIEVARREHPDLRFEVGSMAALDFPDGSLAGALAWYSLIHIPTPALAPVVAELHRVLAPGGRLVVAFQVGPEPRRISHAYGHDVDLMNHRRTPADMANLLTDAGFQITHRLERAPEDRPGYSEPQAYLLAQRPGPSRPGTSTGTSQEAIFPRSRARMT
jgi:SAM-dependent methyltransferase